MEIQPPEKVNGQPQVQVTVDQFLDAQLTAPAQYLVNGALVSLQQIPSNLVIVKLCRVFGRIVGACTATGMLPQLLAARKECTEAFQAGLREVPIQPAAANSPVQSATINLKN